MIIISWLTMVLFLFFLPVAFHLFAVISRALAAIFDAWWHFNQKIIERIEGKQ